MFFFGIFGPKKPQKATRKALFRALRGRCPKLLKKHSVGHFQARAPEHSCKWRPGSQTSDARSLLRLCCCAPVCYSGKVALDVASRAPRVETFTACTEADLEDRPCARENCAKLVCGAFPTGPRKFVRKMYGGIQKCAEIVRNLCGGAPEQFAESIGVVLPRMCVHKFRAIFSYNLNFSLRPSCTGKKCLNPRDEGRSCRCRPFEGSRGGRPETQ